MEAHLRLSVPVSWALTYPEERNPDVFAQCWEENTPSLSAPALLALPPGICFGLSKLDCVGLLESKLDGTAGVPERLARVGGRQFN